MCPLQAPAGTLECAGHRADRVLEGVGDFLRRPAENVAQDQDGTLFGRKELDCSDKGEFDGLTRNQVLEQPIRIRLEVVEFLHEPYRLRAPAC
jgi:hypothetical protein